MILAYSLFVLSCLGAATCFVSVVRALRQAAVDARIQREMQRHTAPLRAEPLTTILPPRPSSYDWSDK